MNEWRRTSSESVDIFFGGVLPLSHSNDDKWLFVLCVRRGICTTSYCWHTKSSDFLASHIPRGRFGTVPLLEKARKIKNRIFPPIGYWPGPGAMGMWNEITGTVREFWEDLLPISFSDCLRSFDHSPLVLRVLCVLAQCTQLPNPIPQHRINNKYFPINVRISIIIIHRSIKHMNAYNINYNRYELNFMNWKQIIFPQNNQLKLNSLIEFVIFLYYFYTSPLALTHPLAFHPVASHPSLHCNPYSSLIVNANVCSLQGSPPFPTSILPHMTNCWCCMSWYCTHMYVYRIIHKHTVLT